MMTVQSRLRRARRALLVVGAGTALAAGALVASTAPQARAAAQGPCDIYASGGTPCVAAHSTTRALYAAYDGPLYQVRRSSDNTTTNISPLTAGGVANAATQNSFCAGTTCVITEIFDQSGNGNNLTDAPGGGAAGGPDGLANATAAPVTVGGQPAYGVYIAQGDGYRDDNTKNIATGNNPEGIYDVVDGTHFNGGCCFDYGNAETNNDDDGAGTMEAVYFGNIKVWGYGTGNGPWIMGDLENGLYSGSNAGYNANDPTTSYRFTTAMVEGGSANQWAILGGNAQSGGLATDFSGTRPSGYYPMKKQGAIILGTGGDNSDGADGTWYEGVMTSGEPSAATESRRPGQHRRRRLLSLLQHRRRGDRADHVGRQQRQVRRRQRGSPPPTAPRSRCGTATAAPTSSGPSRPTAPCRSTASAWTSPAPTTATAPSSSCGTATAAANQQWQASNGELVNPASGKCLDDPNFNTANGTQLELWTCNGGTNQQWHLP